MCALERSGTRTICKLAPRNVINTIPNPRVLYLPRCEPPWPLRHAGVETLMPVSVCPKLRAGTTSNLTNIRPQTPRTLGRTSHRPRLRLICPRRHQLSTSHQDLTVSLSQLSTLPNNCPHLFHGNIPSQLHLLRQFQRQIGRRLWMQPTQSIRLLLSRVNGESGRHQLTLTTRAHADASTQALLRPLSLVLGHRLHLLPPPPLLLQTRFHTPRFLLQTSDLSSTNQQLRVPPPRMSGSSSVVFTLLLRRQSCPSLSHPTWRKHARIRRSFRTWLVVSVRKYFHTSGSIFWLIY